MCNVFMMLIVHCVCTVRNAYLRACEISNFPNYTDWDTTFDPWEPDMFLDVQTAKQLTTAKDVAKSLKRCKVIAVHSTYLNPAWEEEDEESDNSVTLDPKSSKSIKMDSYNWICFFVSQTLHLVPLIRQRCWARHRMRKKTTKKRTMKRWMNR